MGENEKRVRLKRDGGKELHFHGELLAEVSNHQSEGPRSKRWHEIRIYRTRAGALVFAAANRARGEKESDRFKAAYSCNFERKKISTSLKRWTGDKSLVTEALRQAGLDWEQVEFLA